MNRSHFLIITFASFALDRTLSLWYPGIFWFLPVALIILGASPKLVAGGVPFFAAATLVCDIFSGFHFGIATAAMGIVWVTMILLRRWIRIEGGAAIKRALFSLLLIALF